MEDEDEFKILIATDCHLGFNELDPIRGNDSMETFEEILSIAKSSAVDYILLSGDLFHKSKPSRKVMHDTMRLLRKYCFGNKPIPFQILSDPNENFQHCSFPTVNYEDPNFNVAIPVFSIHGNHDDPTGAGNLCSLDLLSVSGLVNYFGKISDVQNVKISPILMQKGSTKVALYGLGSMKDERLHRLMREGCVSFLCPSDGPKNWFNIMSIHQNRAKHGLTNYIPEEFLDDFLNLVIWGHEHECRIEPEWNGTRQFDVSQPGSSVATSLAHGEAVPKHIGILKIKGLKFEMIKVPLTTVRPMYVEDIDLSKCHINYDLKISETVVEYCKSKMESILAKCSREHAPEDESEGKLPLVRLRIEYTKEDQLFNIPRFGQLFLKRVANPKDVIIFHKKRKDKEYKFKGIDAEDMDQVFSDLDGDIATTRLEDIVKSYFENVDESKKLMLLTDEGLADALREFVVKEESSSIPALVEYQMQKVQSHLKAQQKIDEETIKDEILSYKSIRQMSSTSHSEAKEALEKYGDSFKNQDDTLGFEDDFPADNESMATKAPKSRGRGKGRARGKATAKGRGKNVQPSALSFTSRKRTLKDIASDDSNDEDKIISDDDDMDQSFSKPFMNPIKRGNNKKQQNQSSLSNYLNVSGNRNDTDSSEFLSSFHSDKRKKAKPRSGKGVGFTD